MQLLALEICIFVVHIEAQWQCLLDMPSRLAKYYITS
uniref:Uncharacterized protein n=1 Tax=Manihot esculenta TaxID=3983 RepID=A0A199UBZ0_MANES